MCSGRNCVGAYARQFWLYGMVEPTHQKVASEHRLSHSLHYWCGACACVGVPVCAGGTGDLSRGWLALGCRGTHLGKGFDVNDMAMTYLTCSCDLRRSRVAPLKLIAYSLACLWACSGTYFCVSLQLFCLRLGCLADVFVCLPMCVRMLALCSACSRICFPDCPCLAA